MENHLFNHHGMVPLVPGMEELTPEQREEVYNKAAMYGCINYVVGIVVFLLLCLLLGACSSPKAVVVERVSKDTLRLTEFRRDSIYIDRWQHDSVIIDRSGDTILVERWHTRNKVEYRDRYLRDSVYISRTDSIPVPYPVVKEVPVRLTAWQQFRLHLANMILMALGVAAALWIWHKRAWWVRIIK